MTIGNILTIVLAIASALIVAVTVIPWACETDGEPWFKRKNNKDPDK